MRLCYLALEAPRQGSASYTHVSEIVKGLARCGWQVDLVAPQGAGEWERPGLAARIKEYLALQLRLALRLRRYDFLYVRGHFLALPIALAAWVLRVPIVHEINGPYDDVFVSYPSALRYRRLLEGMQRLQYRLADGLAAVTEGLSAWARNEAGGRPVRLIPNGADTDLFTSEAVAASGLPERYVIFFGGFAKWHGIEIMLEAVERPEWPAGVHLVLVGDGAEAAAVAAAAKRLSSLHWLGRRDPRELPGLIVLALAALVPITDPSGRSRTGLAPLKLFEALACGVPVIASDFPGQAEFVRAERCGLVFPSGDAAGLARCVAELAADPASSRQMGRRGQEAVRRDHSWERLAKDLDEFLTSILAARRGPAR